MSDPAGKKAARRTMGKAVPESDIDRLLSVARAPADTPATASAAAPGDLADRLDLRRSDHGAVMTGTAPVRGLTVWDVPVLLLYACLGIFTRIWTDATLNFDFGTDNGLRMFAIGVSIALHLFIFAIIGNAWRARWQVRSRNLLAVAALVGYLGFRMLTQL